MARPRVPKAILKELPGVKKNPKRARERENEPESPGKLGKPPAWFLLAPNEMGYHRSLRLRAIWRQVAADAPWLDRANRLVVEAYCYATDEAREAFRLHSKNFATLVAAQARIANDLGIPQAARAKVNRELNDTAALDGASVRMNLEIDL